MSNTLNNLPIGTDGAVPILVPNSRFQIWALNEIYLGTTASQKFIPSILDYVVDNTTDEWFKVSAINPTTFIPTLDPVSSIPLGAIPKGDLLVGPLVTTQSDTYRVYIDKSVMPYSLAVDARLKVAGSMVANCVIFQGNEIDGTANAISAIYDQSGNLLGEAIPLELAAMDGNNVSIKTVPVCYTVANLSDGEVVTAVFYSATGKVVSKRQLLVENTAFIRSSNSAVKYITNISLESPFLSQTDNTLIQYPLNVPIDGLTLIGVVTYSDGSQVRLPVDNTKFSIFGFAGFLATIVGQQFPLVLKYSLSPGEVAYGSQNTVGERFMTATYKAITVKPDGAYTVKLFGYPIWIDANNGYRIEWFLYTLDRTVMYRVTPYVRFDNNSPGFDPTAYGVVQNLAVNINLNDVSGTFKAYTHVQTESITLLRPATDHTNTPWTIQFKPGQTPAMGNNNIAISTMVSQNLWNLNIASGYTDLNTWLQNLYLDTLPLTNPDWETTVPTPTHFSLLFGTTELQFPMSAWNTSLSISNPVPDSTTLFIKLLVVTPNNTLQLGITALNVKQS